MRSMTRLHAAALLGVEPDANVEDVKNAFRQYARTHHPDHGGDRKRFDDALDGSCRCCCGPLRRQRRQRVFIKHESWWRQLRARRSR